MIKLPTRYSNIIKPLSGGGMSDTVIAFDENLQRKVVVKSLKPGIENHRLMDELSALADIRSKYVVQVLDIIRDGTEVVGFVEEYIEGSDLKPFSETVDLTDRLKSIYSIAAGISDIHEFARVHRDIKPDNMKRDSSGVLKIFDFGLSKISSNAKTKQLYFTQYYTAPEVFNPDPSGNHIFTPAVDVFAFGVTALWLYNNGVLPSELGCIPPVTSTKPNNFDTLAAYMPPAIISLLNRCLSTDYTMRPSSIELKLELGRHILQNKHRMLLTYNGNDHFVDKNNSNVLLQIGQDSITINYNGIDFVVTAVSGQARHNNKQVVVGFSLQGSAVIVLGDPQMRGRTSITADISHPEVMS